MFTRPPPKMSVEVLERAKEWRKRQTEEKESQELDLNNLPPGYEVCQDGDPEMWWGARCFCGSGRRSTWRCSGSASKR